MFVFGPSLLFIGSASQIVQTTVTAIIGVVCLSAGLSGYLLHRAALWERALLVVSALVLIKPGLTTDLIGLALIGVTVASQMLTGRSLREGKAG
jgi:TRAP-type uncharacterized transport system fused permease subunit